MLLLEHSIYVVTLLLYRKVTTYDHYGISNTNFVVACGRTASATGRKLFQIKIHSFLIIKTMNFIFNVCTSTRYFSVAEYTRRQSREVRAGVQ